MGGDSEQKEVQKSEISKDIRGPAKDVLGQMMMVGQTNPWDMTYRGPQMAAVNQAEIDAMNAQAAAGNAFNMGMTSAAESLPQSTMIGGMPAYDVFGLAQSGISPEMQGLLDMLYRGVPAAPAPQAPAAPAIDPSIQDEVDRMSSWDRSVNRHGINSGRLRERR